MQGEQYYLVPSARTTGFFLAQGFFSDGVQGTAAALHPVSRAGQRAEFTFTSGLNILWGSSDTGKTFLVQAIDFMLGAGDPLEDIPERSGYDRVLLGLTIGDKDYTIHGSINGGAFRRFDGLLLDLPEDQKAGKVLSAIHSSKNLDNLSNWLLQEAGLEGKEILYSKTSGKLKSLGFRALAHLCIIIYPNITKKKSPILSGQFTSSLVADQQPQSLLETQFPGARILFLCLQGICHAV